MPSEHDAMSIPRISSAAIALGVLFGALAGCSSSRSNVTVQESTKISKGQELTDLQRARQAGAINARAADYTAQLAAHGVTECVYVDAGTSNVKCDRPISFLKT